MFSGAKDLVENPTESPSTGAPNTGWVGSNWRFSTNLFLISGTVQDRDIIIIIAMES